MRLGGYTVLGPEFRLRDVKNGKFTFHWKVVVCRCKCGKIAVVRVKNLLKGTISGCGCERPNFGEIMANKNGCHRESKSPLYERWDIMIDRCTNPKNIGYNTYGGRGVRVCDEWANDYTAFRDWAISHGWDRSLQIDRIDTNGNYEPENCRFVTSKVNNRNKREHRLVTAWGETKIISEWAEDSRCVVNLQCLWRRLKRSDSNPEASLVTPVNATKSLARRKCLQGTANA